MGYGWALCLVEAIADRLLVDEVFQQRAQQIGSIQRQPDHRADPDYECTLSPKGYTDPAEAWYLWAED